MRLRKVGSPMPREEEDGGKAHAKGRERAKHEAWREAVRFVAVI